MMIPFIAGLIADKCLDHMLDPITRTLEVADEYSLHPGMIVKKIRFRAVHDTSITALISNATYIGVVNDEIKFNIDHTNQCKVITKLPSNDAAIRLYHERTFNEAGLVYIREGAYVIGSPKNTNLVGLPIDQWNIEYVEI